MQTAIPCVLMRSGTSRGPFLLAKDLPKDIALRDGALLALMGSPHPMQLDGIGGSRAQTSKVAIVSPSMQADCDIDYLFAQVSIEDGVVDTRPNCGNMLAGVAPFAIEAGLVHPVAGRTRVRIFNVNTGARVESLVETPDGKVTYDGDASIPGVNGSAAPVWMTMRDFTGSKTGSLFPTGNRIDVIDGVEMTLIDSAMPMMLVAAESIGIADMDAARSIEKDRPTLARIEALRVKAGHRMGLGDVSGSVIPKVGLLFSSREGSIGIAYLMPWSLHRSLAVTGCIALAAASVADGTIANRLTRPVGDMFFAEHPAGIMEIGVEKQGDLVVAATVLRTVRRLFEGRVFLPDHFFQTQKQTGEMPS